MNSQKRVVKIVSDITLHYAIRRERNAVSTCDDMFNRAVEQRSPESIEVCVDGINQHSRAVRELKKYKLIVSD